MKGITAVAAALLLFAGLQLYPALLLRWQADYLTATGELQQVTLPDGSHMTLNTASAVALDFKEGRRRIKLLAGRSLF